MYRHALTVFILFLLAGVAGAGATQTGWYLGGGYPGPVVGWPSPTFNQSSDICFWGTRSTGSTGPIKLSLSLADRTQIDVTNEKPVSVYSSDLDGDGDQDVIALFGYLGGAQQVLWWENYDGEGVMWLEHTVDIGFPAGANVVSSDIDGNGTMDIVAAGWASNVSWWSNTDGTGTQWEEHLACDIADWVECADMDGDGDMDLALSSWGYDTFLWCENIDGIGETWVEHGIAPHINGAICGNPSDINSDGYTDFIGLECFGDKLYWWENDDGTGTTWTEHVISSSFLHPQAMHAGDMDGDGDYDVAAVSGDGGDVVWFRNDDGLGGAWTEVTVTVFTYPPTRQLFDVQMSDLDADGDMDICGLLNCTGGSIFWCENLDGIGETWEVLTFVPPTHSPWSVRPVDINGDGKNDLITCMAGMSASYGGDVTWWDLNEDGYSTDGSLESSILDTDIASPDYHTLEWESDVPAGTTLYLQIRASDDYNDMGDWSEPLYTSPVRVGDVVGDGEKYFQYKVNMSTTDPYATPWLAQIALSWGLLDDVRILSAPSNPLTSCLASLIITCDNLMTLELSIFDLSGRRVFSVPEKQYEAGISTVPIQNIPSGIYLCLLSGKDFHESLRVVLTE